MGEFHGAGKRSAFFEGWYLKHQSGKNALALIPAWHVDRRGRDSASLQVVTPGRSWTVPFSPKDFRARSDRFQVRLGGNLFTGQGVILRLRTRELELSGLLRYGPLAPPEGEMMGPFRFLPGMECRHGVLSFGHRLTGTFFLNGERLDFDGGLGYLEKDWGSSFPRDYLWTQCGWRDPEDGSVRCVMLSLARIPYAGWEFPGCIASVWDGVREFRFATYHGARIEEWSDRGARLRQGSYCLEVRLLENRPLTLRAPHRGGMTRAIRESLCCRVRYRFWCGKVLLLDHTDEAASFEAVGNPPDLG